MNLVERTHAEENTFSNRIATEFVPLSFPQRRIWLLHQLEGSSTEYNMLWAQRLRGHLNIGALGKALTAIAQRHEPLRIHLSMQNGMPVQSATPADDMYLIVEDLSAFPATAQQARVDSAVWQEANTPFDLTRGPMLRTRLLRCGPEDYVWIRVVHHISYDGWSDGVFCRELHLLYDAFSKGLADPLPPLLMQYRRFVELQQEAMAGRDESLTYWSEQLAGIPERLEIPTDPASEAGTNSGYGLQYSDFQADELPGIRQFSRANAVTLYMTMLAAFGVLLARYSCQNDIVVGSPIANRRSSAFEGIIGCFFNMLAMRMQVELKMTFEQLLNQVRETTLGAYEHQDIPFDRIVQEIAPRRTGGMPISQVVFSVQDAGWPPLQLSGLQVEAPFRAEKLRSRSDLELQVSLRQGEPALCWFFNKGLFQQRRIVQMARHYKQLLKAILANPDLEIGRLRMLDETDYAWIEEFNATDHQLNETTLSALFEKQVIKTPDASALICGEQRFTYEEINERANRAAHFLIAQGIGPGDIVAIATDRTPDMITALLGTVKAGAAYLPLDPELPALRLSLILEDARPRCVLTNAAAFSSLSAAARQFAIHHIAECINANPGSVHNPVPEERTQSLTSASPAYIIYTSGSAGTPKGAIGLQAGLVNRLEWMKSAFPAEPEERVLARTSISFIDGSTELLGALSQGATVVLADSATARDPAALTRLIAAHRVGRITLVPSFLRALLDEPESHRLSCCKLWISSGEALPDEYVRRLYQQVPHSRLVNLYGCTECSGDSLFFECTGGAVSAGRPIWNTRAYIVNEAMHINPVGVTGELCIAGVGPAQGYLRRPELTAERFQTDPFGSQGGTMYRTGDLARWRADGNIEVLGRADRQVKIRGQRIELGEVEAALRSVSTVRDAVVNYQASDTGESQLVGYVVPVSAAEVDVPTLKRELLPVLPNYMIPSIFHIIPSIPALINGKPDRSLLAALDYRTQSGQRSPRSQREATLCGLFAEVLGVPRVGIDDDFFELGGHSLSATQLINRMRETFGIELTLRSIFETGSVANLTERYQEVFAVHQNASH